MAWVNHFRFVAWASTLVLEHGEHEVRDPPAVIADESAYVGEVIGRRHVSSSGAPPAGLPTSRGYAARAVASTTAHLEAERRRATGGLLFNGAPGSSGRSSVREGGAFCR